MVSWADEVTGEVSLSTCHCQPVRPPPSFFLLPLSLLQSLNPFISISTRLSSSLCHAAFSLFLLITYRKVQPQPPFFHTGDLQNSLQLRQFVDRCSLYTNTRHTSSALTGLSCRSLILPPSLYVYFHMLFSSIFPFSSLQAFPVYPSVAPLASPQLRLC